MHKMRRIATLLCGLACAAALLSACGPNNSPSKYGVNVGPAGGERLMREAGFKWVRWFVGWEGLQPNGPVLDVGAVNTLRAQLETYTRQGFSVSVVFTRTVPEWAKDWSQPRPCEADKHKDERRPLEWVDRGDGTQIRPFQEFTFQFASAFKDIVAAFEIYNEPELDCRFPGTAAEFRNLMLGPGYDGLHAGAPNAVILGPAIAHDSELRAYYTYPKGDRHYLVRPVAATNVHHYGSVTDITDTMDAARDFQPCTEDGTHCLSKYWLTEFGFDGNGTEAGNNAVDVFKHCDGQARCVRAFYFSSNTIGPDLTDFRLLNDASEPRAKYFSIRKYLLSREPALPPPPPPTQPPPRTQPDVTAMPGKWTTAAGSGFAYVTGDANGFAVAVMAPNAQGALTWQGVWWDQPGIAFNDVSFIPADADGDGLTDLYYTTSAPNGDLVIGLARNTGSSFVWAGTQWAPPHGFDATNMKFIGGTWTRGAGQGFAYVTGDANGFAVAVMKPNTEGTVSWQGIWWDQPGIAFNDVSFTPADADGDGLTDLYYMTSAPNGDLVIGLARKTGSSFVWAGTQWAPPHGFNRTNLRIVGTS